MIGTAEGHAQASRTVNVVLLDTVPLACLGKFAALLGLILPPGTFQVPNLLLLLRHGRRCTHSSLPSFKKVPWCILMKGT